MKALNIKNLFGTKDESVLKIQTGKSLLREHRPLIQAMRKMVGVQTRYWEYFYLKSILRLAEFVQLLPASEAHHHSGRGGLLAHSIETTANALTIRRGKLLPPNADAETVTRLKDVWTYAVFVASLCHDLGKPIADVEIELFDKHRKSLGFWQPFKSSLLDAAKTTGATTYEIKYKRTRSYRTHERASLLYVQRIVPPEGLQWIASDAGLFYHWTNIMTGHTDDSGMIGSIIRESDQASVASNLAGDQITSGPIASTDRKPLYQRVLTSLRHQIEHGALPLNRDGAAGWIVAGKLWVVVKRSLDQVRDAMGQEGQTGIPARNDRIMDELQQYGVLIPNGDKAVWKCRVFAPQWPKAHELTLLCLSVEQVWSSPDAVPGTFDGFIEPLDSPVTTKNDEAPHLATESANISNSPNTSQESPTPADTEVTQLDPVAAGISEKPQAPPTIQTPLIQPDSIEPPSIDFGDFADISDTVANEPESTAPDASATREVVSGKEKQAPADAKTDTPPSPGVAANVNAGEQFLEWLRDGLAERTFNVNDVQAKIHRTQEGLLLVSPAIFKQFDQDKWSYVQKRFTKLKLHERNTDGTNIHEYIATGRKRRSRIKGFLITDVGNVFPGIELPNINHKLSKPSQS